MTEVEIKFTNNLNLAYLITGVTKSDGILIDECASAQLVLDAVSSDLEINPTACGNSLTIKSQNYLKRKLIQSFENLNNADPHVDPTELTIVITIIIGKVTITITIKF